MSGWRSGKAGSAIDRSRPVEFGFDGKDCRGLAGDTLASALLASGERIVGRSFKYRRPRGLFGHGGEEPNAIFDVRLDGHTTPNVRATLMPLEAGMELHPVNAGRSWGLIGDPSRHLDWLHRFLPAGFYYKTFMAGGWMRWEPMIRRMAGLGNLDKGNEPRADALRASAQCDLLVIGGGPAGLAAANAAARRGDIVWLADEAGETGGSLRWRGGQIDGTGWQAFRDEVLGRVRAAGGRVLVSTIVWGAFDHNLYAAWERRSGMPDRAWNIRPKRTVLAAGAIERPLWFANNDLPGVMSAQSALHYLQLYGAVAGREIVVATGNDASHDVAAALAGEGASVTLVDARDVSQAPDGVTLLSGSVVRRAIGRKGVEAVDLADRRIAADTLLVSGGYTPSVHLFMQAGGKLDWSDSADALVPRPGSAPLLAAGGCNGAFGLSEALSQGHAAGGGKGRAPGAEIIAERGMFAFRPDVNMGGRIWIDHQNDVTLKDVKIAQREGFVSVEHLKRYTTLGMATDQGRNSNFAGLAAMAAITGRTIVETGTTTYRPPFTPVPLSLVGGRRRGEAFNPLKRLELENLHREAGARFREYGGWLRPSAYGEGGEIACAQAEALAARQGAGIFDASPLGKIEVTGPGSGELLDFCGYVRMSTLKPGRARYGFMLGENGVVHDDGVVLRLESDRFIVSASSSHVNSVRMILEEGRQDRFDPSRVHVHDVTANWVTLTVSGPASMDLLQEAGLGRDLAGFSGLAHMGVTETVWKGMPLRVARISFTGDRSYELSVPARHAARLHEVLDRARTACGGRWIGLEAVMILRAEKGYLLIGKDSDGITMPHDLGWGGPRLRREDEYFGKRSLFTPEANREDRRQLVGLAVADDEPPLACGAHLVPTDAGRAGRRSLGFVTSSHFSPVLGRPIALAQLESGHSRIGEQIGVFHLGDVRLATVTPACAFDPQGELLHG